jgi:hypothetical protein
MSGESINYRMTCNQCGQHIEFPAESEGATIPCPHCGKDLLLYRGVRAVGQAPATPAPLVYHQQPTPRRGGNTVVVLGFVACFIIILLMGGFICFQSFVIAKSKQSLKVASVALQQDTCINNLRQIDAAVNQFALEHGKTSGSDVTVDDLTPYLPKNVLPVCPSGGSYTIGKVGEIPKCSIAGHELP